MTNGTAEQGVGWVLFAGIMLMIIGILNCLWGISAIANSHIVVNGTSYVIDNRQEWGWVMLIIGAIQLFAAFSIWSGGEFGRWIGIIVASLNALAQLLSMPNAFPFWALAIFTIDILIIYGLVAYGGRQGPAGQGV